MNLPRILLFAALILPAAFHPLWAGTSSISKRLERIADGLTKEYRTKHPGREGVVLAIFTLSSSRTLERRRVGFAVSELLLPFFVQSPLFQVVERTKLGEVMREQRLQLTGAVDPDTAVRIGKLTGAKVLLLGSVETLGGKYHVTVRLVDAENAEVIAVGYGDLPAHLFEDQARQHLAYDPGRPRKFGVFFLYNYRPNTNNLPPAFHTTFGVSGVTVPKSFSLTMLGVGFRYLPIESLALQFSGAYGQGEPTVATFSRGVTPPIDIALTQTFFVRGSAFWTHSFNPRVRLFAGGGAAMYFLGQENDRLETFSYVAPTLRTGLEYRSPDGFAAGIFLNYDLVSKVGKTIDLLGGVEAYKLGKFSVEPSFSIYF